MLIVEVRGIDLNISLKYCTINYIYKRCISQVPGVDVLFFVSQCCFAEMSEKLNTDMFFQHGLIIVGKAF